LFTFAAQFPILPSGSGKFAFTFTAPLSGMSRVMDFTPTNDPDTRKRRKHQWCAETAFRSSRPAAQAITSSAHAHTFNMTASVAN
jgi:hypothetical protein